MVDQRCRESEGKAKIEGYMSVSDEETHQRARLDTYDLEIYSILRERETCAASVKELEEVLAAEESTDEEAEMRKEKARYDAKRAVTLRREVVEEEDKDGGESDGESESDEEDNEPIRGPGLSAKVQGKHPAK